MIETLEQRFKEVAPGDVDFCSLRYMRERSEHLSVRQDVLQPVGSGEDAGVMITVRHGGGLGYAATGDLSVAGLKRAVQRARDWAARTAGRSVVDFRELPNPNPQGEYATPVEKPWGSRSLEDRIDLLKSLSAALKTDDRIVDWAAGLGRVEAESLLLTAGGGRLHQTFDFIYPSLRATANAGAETQTRSFGRDLAQQGGLEVLDAIGFREAPARIAEEAVALLTAPNCPSGKLHLLLGPDQMVLQIHESIGHPLELDRILGDERNYAGTSFVTLDMFGEYRYGSDLLNVVFDPTQAGELASYGFDDDGAPATKEYVIKGGILQRPLGGTVSRARAAKRQAVAGTANSRASSWNRPPIDRMANLNVEPGSTPLDAMIKSVERGVFMKTNRSWSIDDSRNKFQFGCEWGRLIEDGELKGLVKNPNYRGISATFWRNLTAVGDAETFTVMGTPNCGKGEPNQVIRVGHASPACLFADVDVFGGE